MTIIIISYYNFKIRITGPDTEPAPMISDSAQLQILPIGK